MLSGIDNTSSSLDSDDDEDEDDDTYFLHFLYLCLWRLRLSTSLSLDDEMYFFDFFSLCLLCRRRLRLFSISLSDELLVDFNLFLDFFFFIGVSWSEISPSDILTLSSLDLGVCAISFDVLQELEFSLVGLILIKRRLNWRENTRQNVNKKM